MKTILVDAVHTFVIVNHGIFQEMHDLLEQYPNTKIILTNANDLEMEKYGLDHMPYNVFTLKHNPNKTDPEYFDFFLRTYSLKAQDVVYFEHDMDAVKSARQLGIRTYHYDHERKDLKALKNFLDVAVSTIDQEG